MSETPSLFFCFLNYFINPRSNEFFAEKLLQHIQEPQNEVNIEPDKAESDAKDDTKSEAENSSEDDTEIGDGKNDTEGGAKGGSEDHSEVEIAHSDGVADCHVGNGSRPDCLPQVNLAVDSRLKNMIQKASERSLILQQTMLGREFHLLKLSAQKRIRWKNYRNV